MTRNMFGWSLPPGVNQRMIDEAAGVGQPCAVCCMADDDCVCHECPECGAQGDPKCYAPRMHPFCGHGMRLTREQVVGRAEAAVRVAQDKVTEAAQYLDYLRDGGQFSEQLDENPDPYR